VTGFLAYRLRADLRLRWRIVLGLVLLVSALGGTVLATVAGARRTSSAYDRLLDAVNLPELLVSPAGGPGFDPTSFYSALAVAPGVRQIGVIGGVPLVPQSGTPSERLAPALGGIGVLASLDGSWGSEFGRPRLVAGRMPDPTRAEEVVVSERLAAVGDLHVGDSIDVVLLTGAETGGPDLTAFPHDGQPIRLTVTGIGVLYNEVVPFGELHESGSILATAPLAALVDRADWNFEGAFVDAEPGADLASMATAIRAIGDNAEINTGGPVFVSDERSAAQQVSDAMRPLAVALAIAATAIGLVGLFVVGQAVSRANREAPEVVDALGAIGLRSVDHVACALGRAAVVGVAGAAGAVVVAVGLSGRFPVGVARVAEPDPGIRLDGPVLGLGAVATAVLTVLSAAPAAILSLRSRTQRHKPSRLTGAAAAGGLPVAAVQGVRFASLGGGARPVPLRSTLLAMTVAITAVLAAATFAGSLVALIDTPSRYGQGWDRMVDAQFGPVPVKRVIEVLNANPTVRGVGIGNYGDVSVNGVPVPAFDIESVKGHVSVGITEGRPAARADEIVLGGETIDRLGVAVGGTVEVDAGDGPHPVQVTGRGVFPYMGQGSFSTTGLGIGAQLGGGALDSFADFEDSSDDYLLDGRTFNFVAIDLHASSASVDADLAELEASVAADDGFAFVRTEQPPTKIRDLDRVRLVPGAMAAVLALIAVAALAHLLFTSVTERRRDLALLRTLGFTRRQLRVTVGWHASVIALLVLVVAIPLGIAIGRAVWHWFAGGLYASAPAEIPWAWLAFAPAATLAFANLVAALPGRRAAETPPADGLRHL
jgi:hypothetical protein